VLALGERIVEELGLADSTDTLGRWMAHRLAELIDRAEHERSAKAREAAAAAASDLVLRMWRHRSAWPQGWPPKSSVAVLRALDPPRFRAQQEPSGNPWLDALADLDRLQHRERQAWLRLGLEDLPFDEEEAWLADGATELTERERETIERLRDERETGIRLMLEALKIDKLPKTAAARRKAAALLLADFAAEREHLLADALAKLKAAPRQSTRRGPRRDRTAETAQ
jgi:hypothetical protein